MARVPMMLRPARSTARQLLTIKFYGAQQSRERLYIVGQREGKLTKRDEIPFVSNAMPPPIREHLNVNIAK